MPLQPYPAQQKRTAAPRTAALRAATDNAALDAASAAAPALDQRGAARVDLLAGGGVADLGAFELAALAPPPTVRTIGDATDRYSRSDPNAWTRAWTAEGVEIDHSADRNGAIYSPVNFGTANPGILSGSDMLNGDLGVSGRAGRNTASPQEIGGTEALRFRFDDPLVSLDLDFARFETGDVARIELFGADGSLVRTETSTRADFLADSLSGITEVVVSAAAGAFTVDSVSFGQVAAPITFARTQTMSAVVSDVLMLASDNLHPVLPGRSDFVIQWEAFA